MEAALIDKRVMVISALDPRDLRQSSIAVAGPAALLVSKLHKIRERLGERRKHRLDDKDALDVLRLLQAIPTSVFVGTLLELLIHEITKDVTRESLEALEELFSGTRSAGAEMAARAAGDLVAPEQIGESCAILTTELMTALKKT
jgi:hypothetical protein